MLQADNRRTTARVVLIMVVSVMTTLVLFSGGPIGAISFAQQQTTSPGFSIKLINPDTKSSNEATGTTDGTDERYHLVAWVNNVPPDPSVEFKYQTGSSEVPIGAGSLIGADTYEFYWPRTAMPADGSYTLRVRLFSGNTPVSQDSETIFVNNDPPPQLPTSPEAADAPNAVEITYPANGGSVGFYRAPGASTYKGQIDVTASPNTVNVRVFYSVARPGNEPDWKSCSGDTGETRAQALEDGVTCTLASADLPQSVTGIAATANDTTAPTVPNVDSGDGHRATGYIQEPSDVMVSPQMQTKSPAQNQTAMPCSDPITARVTDQNDRHIAGANVDVHAEGPTDLLFFDDSGDNSSAHQAPDQAHTGSESGVDCESTTQPPPFSGSQGFHSQSGADLKHIESAAAGTNGLGLFKFQLHSRDPGTTQFSVWVDEDNNDRQCPNEPEGTGSIGWGTSAPSPIGVPADESTCPSPTGTGTTSPSPSTTSPSPTPTNTSPSPTPTNTTPPPPVVAESTITINYDGNSFDGKVKSDLRKCRKDRKVVAKKVKPGRDKKVGSDTTNRRGKYSILERNADGTYYTVAKKKTIGNVTCLRDRSPKEKV